MEGEGFSLVRRIYINDYREPNGNILPRQYEGVEERLEGLKKKARRG
jgi:hypothetical protein